LYVVVAVGLTVHVRLVLEQLLSDQAYVLAPVQLAVRMDEPPAGIAVGLAVSVHIGAVWPSCVNVSVLPAMTNVPVREEVLAFAAMV
jgi:hypothetical protein